MSALVVFGCGYTGSAYVRQFASGFSVCLGSTRLESRTDDIAEVGARPFLFDSGKMRQFPLPALPEGADVLVSIAPGAAGDPVLTHIAGTLAGVRPRWIGYLSTVGVYGDHGGAWVNEQSELRPVSQRSVQRVAAELQWQEFAGNFGFPLSILRLSGIYGPRRNPFLNLRDGTARRLIKPGQVFNRIHVADIAKTIEAARLTRFDGLINVTDNEPAPPQDVVTFAAKLMDVQPPAAQDFETAELTPMARSFYGENKRVANRVLRETLGVTLDYPDYRAALAKMWADKSWI